MATLLEVIALLGQCGYNAKILSGRQRLVPLVRCRLAQPAHLVEINRIDGPAYVHEEDGSLRIGALPREADVVHCMIASVGARLLDGFANNQTEQFFGCIRRKLTG